MICDEIKVIIDFCGCIKVTIFVHFEMHERWYKNYIPKQHSTVIISNILFSALLTLISTISI